MPTIEELERILEHAPSQPGPIAQGLLGWIFDHGPSVCSHCAGRIVARGSGDVLRGGLPIWADERGEWPGCALPSCIPSALGKAP